MSAPDTNIDRQAERHKPSLIGIRGAMIFGVLMIVLMIAFTMSRGEAPTEDTIMSEEGAATVQSEGAAGTEIDPVTPGTNESN